MEKIHLGFLDFLKGIAILMIILVHSGISMEGINQTLRESLSFGQMGCQLFFIISGFAISLSWFQKKRTVFQFYKNRYISIAPAYYIAIIFWLILNFLIFHIKGSQIGFDQNNDLWALIFNFLFLHGVIPFCNNNVVPGGWYIGTTMLFYLIFPLLIRIINYIYIYDKKYFYALPFVVYLFSCFLTSIISRVTGDVSFAYFNIINQLPCLIIGIILYYQYYNGNIQKIKLSYSFLLAVILLIFSIWIFYKGDMHFITTSRAFLCAIAYYFVFVFVFNGWNVVIKESSWFVQVCSAYGRVSYFAFFVHFPFVIFVPPLIIKILKYNNVFINHTSLYLIIMVILLPIIYYFSQIFKKYIVILQSYIRSMQ